MQALAHRSLFGLSDHALLADLRTLLATERATTVEVALHLAEVERRKLHKRLGHEDLYQYCVQHLRMSEGAALRRIRAGRAARRYPAVLAALEDGRLHMSAVVELAPHLKPDTVDELVAAAAHKSRREIERMLGGRKPRPRPRARIVDAFVVQEPQPVGIVPVGAPVEPTPLAA